MFNTFLYIDPGTGSMLFSIFIGIITAGYFLIKAAWVKLKFVLSGGKADQTDQIKHGIVIYSEGNQYWNVFVPILEEFEKREKPITYFTSSEDDPVFSKKWNYIVPKFIGVGNKAFMKLNTLEAKVCLLTTPGLDVYQLKRSKKVNHYAHVLHAVDDATSYRLFGLDYFDSVLLTGEFQKKHIRQLEDFNKEIYDASDIEEEAWKFKAIKKIGFELNTSMFNNIKEVIESLSNDTSKESLRLEARDEAWQYRGKSANRIADFLIAKEEEHA